jgi:hypothetical protein
MYCIGQLFSSSRFLGSESNEFLKLWQEQNLHSHVQHNDRPFIDTFKHDSSGVFMFPIFNELLGPLAESICLSIIDTTICTHFFWRTECEEKPGKLWKCFGSRNEKKTLLASKRFGLSLNGWRACVEFFFILALSNRVEREEEDPLPFRPAVIISVAQHCTSHKSWSAYRDADEGGSADGDDTRRQFINVNLRRESLIKSQGPDSVSDRHASSSSPARFRTVFKTTVSSREISPNQNKGSADNSEDFV